MLLLAGVFYIATSNAPDTSVYLCEGVKEQHSGMTLVSFKNAGGTPTKALTIYTSKRDILVDAGKAKGVIDWKDIRAVRYRVETGTTGVLEIEYEGPRRSPYTENIDKLSFGNLPQDCWEKVVAAFDGQVPTKVVVHD